MIEMMKNHHWVACTISGHCKEVGTWKETDTANGLQDLEEEECGSIDTCRAAAAR